MDTLAVVQSVSDMNWNTIIIAGISALSALFGSGLTLFIQYKLKKVELDKQNEFKAREHIFNFRQYRIQDRIKSINKLQKSFGNLVGSIMYDEPAKITKDFRILTKSFMAFFSDKNDLVVLENDLKENGLLTSEREITLKKTRNILDMDFSKINPESYKDTLFLIMTCLANIQDIEITLMEKNIVKIYKKYLED